MLFSIVLPTYNVAPYIERCIKSLQAQTYNKFEMIFVDDCGDDSSIEIVKRYKSKDPRIRIINNPRNMGTYHAREKGVEKSIGKYIIFIDPDDTVQSDLLRKLADRIELEPVDIIFYNFSFSPTKRIYQNKIQALPFKKSDRILEAVFKNGGKKSIYHGTAGKVYKRDLLRKTYNKLDININNRFTFSEDQLLYYAILFNNPSYTTLIYNGYIYHQNKTSITNKDKLVAPESLINQKKFTIEKIKNMSRHADLTKKEREYLNTYTNSTSMNEIYLMQRYEENGKRYLYYTWEAFKILPSTKGLLRILAYIMSFRKIRL